jgi:ABC-type glycerol-3-phosphate transport system substrate-binding protein
MVRGTPGRRTDRRTERRTALGALAGGAAGGVVLAACGAGGPADPPAAPVAAPARLLLQSRRQGSGVSEVEYWEKTVARFNKQQRRAEATFEAFPPDKGPQVLAAAGVLGDVVRAGGWGGEFPGLAVKGYLADLTPHIQRERYDLKQFYPASIESLRLRSKQLGLPHVAHPGFGAHYLNLDALAQAGVSEPDDATWTHVELDALLKRLASSGRNDGSRWAAWPPTQLQHLLVAARAFGGDLLSRDGKRSLVAEPEAVAGLQLVADLIIRNRLAPPPGTLQGAAVNHLIQGTVAAVWWNMFIIGTLKQQGQGLRWKAFLAPKGPKGRGIFMTTDPITVGAASKAPDRAFELARHAVAREANLDWYDMTGNPGGRVDFWEDRRVTDDPTSKVFARAIAESTPLHHADNGLGDEHNQAVDRALGPLWAGTATVRDAADAARRAAQEVLDRSAG